MTAFDRARSETRRVVGGGQTTKRIGLCMKAFFVDLFTDAPSSTALTP